METEIRVYVADSTDWYQNLDGQSDIGDVMDCAEAQGTVMTLPTFIKQFNNGELNLSGENTIIRMAEYETEGEGFFLKEVL